MTRHYLDLLSQLGVVSDDERMLLAISEEERERADRHLEELSVGRGESFFAVNPGASFGASKCWTVEGFAEVVRQLGERARSLILCGPGEEQWAQEISSRCGECAVDTSRRVLPLELLKPVLQRARILVTTDTGPRHIAAAVGTPQVSLLGPTDARYSSTNLERTRVLQVEVECGPCHLKVCPLDHRCMVRLTPDMVMAAVEDLLETGHAAQGVSACQS
jgi:heptosyltransferase-2